MRFFGMVRGVNESEGRKRLAVLVQADRGRLYRTVDKARIAADISRGSWESVEAGRAVKDFTLAAVEAALEWPAGRAKRVIAGEEEGAADGIDSDLRTYILNAGLPKHIQRSMIALLDSSTEGEPSPEVGRERGTA